MSIQIETYKQQTFTGSNPKRGARHISQVMNKLHESAYRNGIGNNNNYDIIQISTTLDNGVEVSAIANFVDGKYAGLSFPKEFAHYRSKFCKKILNRYNEVVTKGKSKK